MTQYSRQILLFSLKTLLDVIPNYITHSFSTLYMVEDHIPHENVAPVMASLSCKSHNVSIGANDRILQLLFVSFGANLMERKRGGISTGAK